MANDDHVEMLKKGVVTYKAKMCAAGSLLTICASVRRSSTPSTKRFD
jgi:hypothetical protein